MESINFYYNLSNYTPFDAESCEEAEEIEIIEENIPLIDSPKPQESTLWERITATWERVNATAQRQLYLLAKTCNYRFSLRSNENISSKEIQAIFFMIFNSMLFMGLGSILIVISEPIAIAIICIGIITILISAFSPIALEFSKCLTLHLSLSNNKIFDQLVAWKDNNPGRTKDAELAIQALVKLAAIDGLALCEDIYGDELLVNFLKEINPLLKVLATSFNAKHDFYLEDYRLNSAILEHLSKMQPQDRLIHLKAVHVKVVNEKLNEPVGTGIVERNCLEQLLLTPFGKPFPVLLPRGRMAALAARGITVVDVHDGNREKKTAEALELLRRHQDEKGVNKTAIKNAAEEFLVSLRDSLARLKETEQNSQEEAGKQKIRDEIASKEKVLFVLEGASNGKDFGPLLSKNRFAIHGDVSTIGWEVLGRICIFINNISDETDQENARHELFSALKDCIGGDGKRVCSFGKTSRIFVAILQGPGRLEGVLIDDSVSLPNDPLSEEIRQEFLNTFLKAEATREIYESEDTRNIRKDLLSAGQKFCLQNPEVDPSVFFGFLARAMAAAAENPRRLAELSIDDLVLDDSPSEEVSKNSLELFFMIPAHQEIYNREDPANIRKDLLSAGQQYCLDNPKVDKTVFFKLLEEFMANDPATFG